MIDKKGKLFGLINIIDLFIIIALIGASIFIVNKFTVKKNVATTTQKVQIKFFREDLAEFTGNNMKVGDNVEDDTKFIYLGKVTNVKIDPGFMYVPNSNGELKKSTKEGYSAVEVTAELDAQLSENGISINNNSYNVGHGMTIKVGKAKMYCIISSIEAVK